LRDNANLMTGRDLLIFLKEWWANHIQDQDKKYAPYLNAFGVTTIAPFTSSSGACCWITGRRCLPAIAARP
jgi:hypothetical protein